MNADIEKEAEASLLEANKEGLRSDIPFGDNIASDVLIAPHHGSLTSSTPAFVQAVGAKEIIFTVGYLNRLKHLNPLIKNRYAETGAHLYRSVYQDEMEFDFVSQQPLRISAWRQLQPKY